MDKWYWLCPGCGIQVNKYNGICPKCGLKKPEVKSDDR